MENKFAKEDIRRVHGKLHAKFCMQAEANSDAQNFQIYIHYTHHYRIADSAGRNQIANSKIISAAKLFCASMVVQDSDTWSWGNNQSVLKIFLTVTRTQTNRLLRWCWTNCGRLNNIYIQVMQDTGVAIINAVKWIVSEQKHGTKMYICIYIYNTFPRMKKRRLKIQLEFHRMIA